MWGGGAHRDAVPGLGLEGEDVADVQLQVAAAGGELHGQRDLDPTVSLPRNSPGDGRGPRRGRAGDGAGPEHSTHQALPEAAGDEDEHGVTHLGDTFRLCLEETVSSGRQRAALGDLGACRT